MNLQKAGVMHQLWKVGENPEAQRGGDERALGCYVLYVTMIWTWD